MHERCVVVQAIERALAQPELGEVGAANRAEAEAAVSAIRRFDNPEATLTRESVSGDGRSETEWQIGYIQPIDISGRPLCLFGAELPNASVAGFDAELTEEFFRAVASNARITVHLGLRYGSNLHHMIEACFKAFARALREAVAIDPDEDGIPSTKGALT